MSKYAVTIDGRGFELEFDLPPKPGQTFAVKLGDEVLNVRVPATDGIDWVIINDRPYELYFDSHWLQTKNDLHTLDLRDRDTTRVIPPSSDGRIKAPIPGMIARILVEVGQAVELGQPILILEAMKMENEIRAPRAGQVASLQVEVGKIVTRSELLAVIG